MTRFALALFAALFLVSCSETAVLYTDAAFRDAAPELVEAWRGQGSLRRATVVDLPPGAGQADVIAALEQDQTPGPVLMGMALSAGESLTLVETFPQKTFLFLTAAFDSNLRTLSVRRSQAWAQVAQAATDTGTAVAMFPADATTAEIDEFTASWAAAGGGPLTTLVGAKPLPLDPAPAQVFCWGGSEAEAQLANLPEGTKVHGNPGLVRPRGTEGLTWTVARQGLGEFLWTTAHNSTKGPQFLPLETVLAHR